MIYRLLMRIANWAGYHFYLSKKTKNNSEYDSIFPNASYAPWLIDNSFIKIYNIIESCTLVDKYRCYELWQLIKETSKLEGALIEIGVWKGGSGALIAKRAKLSDIEDSVYLCDTFTGVVKAGEKDLRYSGGEHSDTSKEKVEELIHKLGLTNVVILPGIFPDESGSRVEHKLFRFCHIDVDVYLSAKDIIDWIWSRLVIGGVVVFDDYGFKGCNGITDFVNEEMNKKDRIVIYNLNGHAIFVKTS